MFKEDTHNTHVNKMVIAVLFFWILWTGVLDKLFAKSYIDKFAYGMTFVIFSLIVVFIGQIISPKRIKFRKNFYSKALVYLSLIICLPLLYSTLFIYENSLVSFFRSLFFYLGYLVFPCLMLADLNRKSIIIIFYWIIMLTSSYILFSSILYLLNSNLLFELGIATSQRYGLARINPQFLTNYYFLTLCFFCALFVHTKTIPKRLFIAALITWVSYYLSFGLLTRQVFFIISIFLIYFMFFKIRSKELGLFTFLIFMLTLSFFIYINFSSTYDLSLFGELALSPFQELESGVGTTSTRYLGLLKYWDFFKNTGFIGIGDSDLTAGNKSDLLYEIRYYYGYNLNDLGIFDTLFRYGFPAIIFVSVVLFRINRDLGRLLKRKHLGSQTTIIVETIKLFVITQIIGIFFTKAFFFYKYSFFYGLLMYYVWYFLNLSVSPDPHLQGKLNKIDTVR